MELASSGATSTQPTGNLHEHVYESDLPARLDRLPWGRFHTLLVAALGITWLLDGLEVTLAGSIAGALKASPALHMSTPTSAWRAAPTSWAR